MFKPLFMTTNDAARSFGFWSKHRPTASARPVIAPAVADSCNQAIKSPIIGVLGAKGGAGSTTIAINLAAALAGNDHRTTLLDANLQQPDAAVALGKEQNFSLMQLVECSGLIDENMLEACSIALSDQLPACRLLSPPQDGGAAVSTHLSEISDCLSGMRMHSAYWVIDLPKHLDRHLVTLIDKCDRIIVVFEATLPSITATKRWLRILQQLDYPASQIVCLLNRTGSKVKLVEQQLEAVAPFDELHRVPNAYDLCEKSIARCEPALITQPQSAYSAAIRKLADSLVRGLSNG